jgi:hypothetical protein
MHDASEGKAEAYLLYVEVLRERQHRRLAPQQFFNGLLAKGVRHAL